MYDLQMVGILVAGLAGVSSELDVEYLTLLVIERREPCIKNGLVNETQTRCIWGKQTGH